MFLTPLKWAEEYVVQVEGNDVRFKLDTGAEVTVVGEKVLHSLESTNTNQEAMWA